MPTPEYLHDGPVGIVFDAARIDRPWQGMFDPRWWRLNGTADPATGGRGAAWRVARDGRAFGLRRYRRGGMVAWVNHDRYLWTGLRRTRAFREWHLLAELHEAGLPVTPPAAARVVRRGFTYRAELLTAWLERTRPLPGVLAARALTAGEWGAVGATLRRMHDAGVFHADLNAHNLLLGDDGAVHLVDFDRARRRAQAPGWRRANLDRLRHSLDKLSAAGALPNYAARDWACLLEAYDG